MRRRGRPKHPDILTPREWEVLALLREHRTNEEIAQTLGVSIATARFHVAEILGKLGVSSREEAAAWQPPPERRVWLLAPLALLRRTSALGITARIAAGGTLALAVVGIALLAWGVFVMRGHARGSTDAGRVTTATTPTACETPASNIAPGLELGSEPIFWRFGLTSDDLTSGRYCGQDFKIVLRVTNGSVGGTATIEAGNAATGAHVSAQASPVTATDALPGNFYTADLSLPSAGEWRLQVRFGNDFSTQIVRIGGPDVPTLAGGPQPPCAPPPQPGGGTPMAVVLVERETGRCGVIPTANRIMQAKWVEDGKTFVAYDTDEKSFIIYDIDGNPLQAIDLKTPDDGTIGGVVSPSPNGHTILVDREIPSAGIHTFVVRDVSTGQDNDFPQPDGINGQASYSPDGTHAAYVNTNGTKQWLVITTTPVTDGHYQIVESVDPGARFIEPIGWSSDGAYLLIADEEIGAPCVDSPDPNCHQFGLTLTYNVIAVGSAPDAIVWTSGSLSSNPFPGAQWVGTGRLAIAKASGEAYIDIPSGKESPAPAALASLGSFAPDGASALSGNKLVDVNTMKTTQAVAYDAGYFADWTADGSEVLLSFAGN